MRAVFVAVAVTDDDDFCAATSDQTSRGTLCRRWLPLAALAVARSAQHMQRPSQTRSPSPSHVHAPLVPQVTIKRDKDCARRVTMLFNAKDVQVTCVTCDW